ncbi:MAG: hypothetical protein HUU35_03905 [Armatimonadetes bacterium]|nr:hypothetical protein [Armatimonadota bacterium]
MREDAPKLRARLLELAQVQKNRHLSEAELWEAADILRALGKESAAQEAEAAALRQRARELLSSPDATFTLGDEADNIDVFYCRECGREINRATAEKHYYYCPECHAKLGEQA